MTSASDEKLQPFNCFFSWIGLRTYQHPCIYWKLQISNNKNISTSKLYLKVGKKLMKCYIWRTGHGARGTRWHSWLRHCVTSRKVAGSIYDGVMGIFQWYNPSGRIYGPGVDSASNRNWVPWIFPEGWRRPVRRVHNLTTFVCRLSWNLGASTSWKPQGLSRPLMGLLFHIWWRAFHDIETWTLRKMIRYTWKLWNVVFEKNGED